MADTPPFQAAVYARSSRARTHKIQPELTRLAKQDKTMKIELPAPIAGFFEAHNSGKTDNFLDLFTADAVVSDESHEYRGDAIKTWIDGAIANYHPLHGEVINLMPTGTETVAITQVSGTFAGSPIQLRYQFTLQDGQIAALRIAP